MQGLAQTKVAVVPYDPAWNDHFNAEAARVEEALKAAGLEANFEHIGSTAIRGLSAKPIVDIAIGVRDQQQLGPALVVLRGLDIDYVKAANQPGMLFFARGKPRTFHYHLVVERSHAWERLVQVRNLLRRHGGLASEYQELKTGLANRFPNSRLEYTAHKGPYVRALERRAFAEQARRAQAIAIGRSRRNPSSPWPRPLAAAR